MDRIAQALTYSLHLCDGYFLEGSWDNAYYTREWNCPPNDPPSQGIQVIIMPASQSEPGGAREFGRIERVMVLAHRLRARVRRG